MERRLGQTAAESASEEERQAFIDRYGFDPENLQVAMVDQSHDAREFARDYADHKLNQELGNAKGFKGFFERVWKGGYAKEYYRQKYARQALEDIKSSQNIYAKEGNEDEATQARLDTIRRFQSEYEEMIHQDNGEQKRDVTHEDSPKIAELKAAIEVFARSDGGQTARNNLEEARKRIVREFATDGNEGSADLVMIDNLTDIAEQARLAVDHGFAIENVMNGMQIINGESRSGVRGEAGLSKVDKVIEKLQAKSRGLVNPATIAIGISIAAAGLKIAEQGGIGRLASIVAPGVAGAMFAGNNERIKLKEERAQHMREKAQGKKMPENDKARAELDATIYDMRGAGEMTTELNNILEFLNNLPQDRALTPEEDNQCIAARSSLIAIDARIRLSDREGVELVSYSDVMKVDAERFALDEARAKTRKALMDYTRNSNPNTHDARGGDEAMRAAFLMDTQQVEEIIKQGEISNKDKLYKKLRDRRARKAALVAGAIGFVVGVGTQEVAAFLSSNVLGGIEHLVNPNATGTKGTFLFDILNGKENGAMILAGATRTLEASDTMNNANTGGNGVVRLSGESSMVQNEDGTFSILDQRQGGQVKIDGLVQDSNTGQFTPESLQRLRESGYQVNVDSNTVLIEQAPASQTITQSVDQYLDGAKNQVTDVTRAFHFDNDSPGIYDYSELRFYADGVDASGNLSFSVGLDGVQPSHGGIAIDLHQEAAAGRLFAQIIPSGDHQGQAILAEIGANGKLNVSPDGPLAQFFSPDGKTLNAKFLEVVQVREDVTKNVVDGITQLTTTDGGAVDVAPIATWVGKNSLETITSVAEVPQPPIPTEIFHTSIVAPDLIEQIPTYITETDMPPIIPIVPRRSLRSAERRTPPRTTPETPPYGHNYGAEDQDFDRWRYWEETRNPILNENPNAELNPEEQLDFYTNQLIERRGVEYIGELEDYVTNNDALRNIDENVKLIVSIPVGAEQESENIYNTLSIYNKQTDSGKNSAVVLMNVNYKESAYNDPAKRILIDKTKSEIERAKHDFPNLKIASFEKVWPNDWVEQRDGKIYGEVVKVLYDTAAYAAKKAIDNRQIPADHDMLIVTNDADLLGMPSTYFDSYVKAEEKKPDQDAFIGSIRWGVEAIRDFPGYHVAQMFQQAMNLVATRRAGGKYVATIGPNAAFRVSSYAAVGGAEDLKFQGAGADSELGRKMLAARGKFFQRGGPNNNISYSTTDNEEIDGNPERQVISLVNGAQIDSDPARSLGQYRTGGEQIWMWNGFDSGQTRAEKATEGNLRPEDIERDFNDISRRITADINGYLNYWYKDEKLARTCLSILWSNGDTEKWRLVRRPNGTFDFKFTPDGLIVLKDGLLRARDTIPSNIYGRPNLKSSVRFVEGNRRYQIT